MGSVCEKCAGEPDDLNLPDPGNGPTFFLIRRKGAFSSSYDVYTEDKAKWLRINNESSWLSSKSHFELENLRGELLCSVGIDGQDADIKRSIEWEGDSDDSDYSGDSDDGDEDDEFKVKLKWKIKREATFKDAGGNVFAKLKVKMKGKSKAEVETHEGEHGEYRAITNAKTKIKKAFYDLRPGGGDKTEIDVENGHWHDWDREWKSDFFDAEYCSKWGIDEVKCKTTGACNASQALAIAFATSYFFHPTGVHDQMHSSCINQARTIMHITSDN